MDELPVAARPREKLARRGVAALSNTELVALLLGGGQRGRNALVVARHVVQARSLQGLAAMTRTEWLAIAGVGPARAAALMAAVELGRRVGEVAVPGKAAITGPDDVWPLVADLGHRRRERLVGLYLDGGHRVMARETLSLGTLNTTRTHPREILEPALRHRALAFILAHNHPGGSGEPSRQDVDFTAAVGRAAQLMDIGFYDHLVVTAGGYTSLRQRGLMPDKATW